MEQAREAVTLWDRPGEMQPAVVDKLMWGCCQSSERRWSVTEILVGLEQPRRHPKKQIHTVLSHHHTQTDGGMVLSDSAVWRTVVRHLTYVDIAQQVSSACISLMRSVIHSHIEFYTNVNKLLFIQMLTATFTYRKTAKSKTVTLATSTSCKCQHAAE